MRRRVCCCWRGAVAGRATGRKRRGRRSKGSAASPSASPVDEPYSLAEDRAPSTRAEAVAFVRELTVRPDYFGAGYRKRDPYESDPADWAGARRGLPVAARGAAGHRTGQSHAGVQELPAKGGKGAGCTCR
ncbi:hypothetical protein ACRAWF_32730 [Streptomyces sp. L7]